MLTIPTTETCTDTVNPSLPDKEEQQQLAYQRTMAVLRVRHLRQLELSFAYSLYAGGLAMLMKRDGGLNEQEIANEMEIRWKDLRPLIRLAKSCGTQWNSGDVRGAAVLATAEGRLRETKSPRHLSDNSEPYFFVLGNERIWAECFREYRRRIAAGEPMPAAFVAWFLWRDAARKIDDVTIPRIVANLIHALHSTVLSEEDVRQIVEKRRSETLSFDAMEDLGSEVVDAAYKRWRWTVADGEGI